MTHPNPRPETKTPGIPIILFIGLLPAMMVCLFFLPLSACRRSAGDEFDKRPEIPTAPVAETSGESGHTDSGRQTPEHQSGGQTMETPGMGRAPVDDTPAWPQTYTYTPPMTPRVLLEEPKPTEPPPPLQEETPSTSRKAGDNEVFKLPAGVVVEAPPPLDPHSRGRIVKVESQD